MTDFDFTFLYEKQKKEKEQESLYQELDIPRQKIPVKKDEEDDAPRVIIIQL